MDESVKIIGVKKVINPNMKIGWLNDRRHH